MRPAGTIRPGYRKNLCEIFPESILYMASPYFLRFTVVNYQRIILYSFYFSLILFTAEETAACPVLYSPFDRARQSFYNTYYNFIFCKGAVLCTHERRLLFFPQK